MKKFDVLIVQQIIPPFRVPFFERLSEHEELSVAICAGEAQADSARESCLESTNLDVCFVKNTFITSPTLTVWQRGVVLPYI